MVIPSWLKEEYPFEVKKLRMSSGHNMSFVDQPCSDETITNPKVMIMVHGNPTWSYYYRNLIKEFSKDFRVIVPDHIGCGLSDKPQDYTYQLKDHIDNLEQLVKHLNISKAHFVVHDWGGAIGFGLIERNPELAEKIIILNTAAYTSDYIPPQINICRTPILGEKIIRGFNAFAWPATFMAVTKKMRKPVKRGFLYPYNNYRNRIATSRFVQDIPMSKNHPSYNTLEKIEKGLHKINCPKLVLWGKQDFCFNDYFLNRWKGIYPDARYVEYPDAGHYVIEDETKSCIKEIRDFT
jgi:pimeloyl-ACP methyl ester carboxylesterase